MSAGRWLTAMSVVSAFVVAVVRPEIRVEVLLGMLAPLFAAVTSLWIIERAQRENPLLVMPIMLKMWAAKVVLFAAYVTLMIKGLDVRPVPFILSFTGYFIALHAAEAILLHRLFSQTWGSRRLYRPVR